LCIRDFRGPECLSGDTNAITLPLRQSVYQSLHQ
jgi:hypothetical protein